MFGTVAAAAGIIALGITVWQIWGPKAGPSWATEASPQLRLIDRANQSLTQALRGLRAGSHERIAQSRTRYAITSVNRNPTKRSSG